MDGGSYGRTSGTDLREARPMMDALMLFDLDGEVRGLRNEEPYRVGDRNSRTLAKETDFRVLLSVLRPGATLDEQDGDARASLQLIDGSATLSVSGKSAELRPGRVAVVDAGQPWLLQAVSECAVLLSSPGRVRRPVSEARSDGGA